MTALEDWDDSAHPCTACGIGWVHNPTGECDEPGCLGDMGDSCGRES
jgi:hypothetical protein